MLKKNTFSNHRGFTLIELIITIALLTIISSIIYPMIHFNNKTTISLLEESDQRNQIRIASSYLTNDIRFSKSLSLVNDATLQVTNNDDINILYKIEADAKGNTFLTRYDGNLSSFPKIKDVIFNLENSNLVAVKLITDINQNKYHNFKVATWEYTIAKLPTEPAENFYDFLRYKNIFVYGNKFGFLGDSINGSDATLVVKSDLLTSNFDGGTSINVANIYIDGNIITNSSGLKYLGLINNTGSIFVNGSLRFWDIGGDRHIYGNVYVNGDFSLDSVIIHGNVYVHGNLELGWTPTIHGHIYYTGNRTYPPNGYSQSIINKTSHVATVPSFKIPDLPLPPLKPDAWYTQNGYSLGGDLANGKKIFTNTNYSSNKHGTFNNVILVSKAGNINLSGGGTHISGVLFAPHGKVTFDAKSFTGIVLSKDGFFVTSGGSTVNFKHIDNYINNINDFPFEVIQ